MCAPAARGPGAARILALCNRPGSVCCWRERLGVRESGMKGVGLGVQMVQFWAVMVANRAG